MRKLTTSQKLKEGINCTVIIQFDDHADTLDIVWKQVIVQVYSEKYSWSSKDRPSLMQYLTFKMHQAFHNDILAMLKKLEQEAQEFLQDPYYEATETVILPGFKRLLLVVKVFPQRKLEIVTIKIEKRRKKWKLTDKWSPSEDSSPDEILSSLNSFMETHGLAEYIGHVASRLLALKAKALQKASA